MDVGSNSPNRDQSGAPALGGQSLSHWTIREVPELFFQMLFSETLTCIAPIPSGVYSEIHPPT